jgi:formylglycine-generating enzyme required for sulfatase activity
MKATLLACAAIAIAARATAAEMPAFIPIPADSGQAPPFRIAETETTVEQFAAFVKATGYRTDAERAGSARTWRAPGFRVRGNQPVVYVTPADAVAYCAFVDARLPGDTEWEYAARAGATTRHYWGDSIDGRYLWYRANSDGRPQPVARKLPNNWGLYDVEGNVWEWALSPPVNGVPLANRRGGSWIDCEDIDGGPGGRTGHLIGLSTYFKVPISSGHRYDDIGFRCLRSDP